MEAKELRIGNYVKFYDPINGTNIYEVYNIDDRGNVNIDNKGQLAYCTVKDIDPIELTEDVLLKIGFVKHEKMFRMELSGFKLDYFIVKVLRIYKKHTDCYFIKNLEFKCEYLHQLQNAFFLLTNQELEMKL